MASICRIQRMEEKKYSKISCRKNSLECRNNFEIICTFHVPENFDMKQLNKVYFAVIYPLGKRNQSSGIHRAKVSHPQEEEIRLDSNCLQFSATAIPRQKESRAIPKFKGMNASPNNVTIASSSLNVKAINYYCQVPENFKT